MNLRNRNLNLNMTFIKLHSKNEKKTKHHRRSSVDSAIRYWTILSCILRTPSDCCNIM